MCQKNTTSALYHFICILIFLVLIKILRFHKKLCVILVFNVHSLITDGVTYLLYNTCIIQVNLQWTRDILHENLSQLLSGTTLIHASVIYRKFKVSCITTIMSILNRTVFHRRFFFKWTSIILQKRFHYHICYTCIQKNMFPFIIVLIVKSFWTGQNFSCD